MFYKQFDKICKQKNTTPTAVTKKLGYSSSKVTAWKNGSIPKEEILTKLAQYLDVNIMDFFDNEKVSETDTKKSSVSLSDSELRLLEYFNLLTVPQQFELLGELKEKTKKVDSSKKEAI